MTRDDDVQADAVADVWVEAGARRTVKDRGSKGDRAGQAARYYVRNRSNRVRYFARHYAARKMEALEGAAPPC